MTALRARRARALVLLVAQAAAHAAAHTTCSASGGAACTAGQSMLQLNRAISHAPDKSFAQDRAQDGAGREKRRLSHALDTEFDFWSAVDQAEKAAGVIEGLVDKAKSAMGFVEKWNHVMAVMTEAKSSVGVLTKTVKRLGNQTMKIAGEIEKQDLKTWFDGTISEDEVRSLASAGTASGLGKIRRELGKILGLSGDFSTIATKMKQLTGFAQSAKNMTQEVPQLKKAFGRFNLTIVDTMASKATSLDDRLISVAKKLSELHTSLDPMLDGPIDQARWYIGNHTSEVRDDFAQVGQEWTNIQSVHDKLVEPFAGQIGGVFKKLVKYGESFKPSWLR